MPAVSSGEQRSRILLSSLIGRVREGRTISDLLAPGADVDLVTATLRPLAVDHAVIDSIAGNHRRIDAVVTTGDVHARVVFAHDAAGLLTWLQAYLRPDRFDGVSGGRVIVINGASGAGKSTLMRALQSVATFPLVVLDEPEQIGTVQPPYLIWRDCAPSLHRGYLAAIGTLAREGNHVALSAAGHPHHEIADAFNGTDCAVWRRDVIGLIGGLQPDLVIMSSYRYKQVGAASGRDPDTVWQEGIDLTVSKVRPRRMDLMSP